MNNFANPLDDWEGFFEEIQGELPRAAVIIASAFLDAQLKAILSNTFIDDSKVIDELFDTDLQSFSSKIKTAYCLGLISKSIYHDLNIIRKIRNKFAHKMHGYSFDEPEIRSWCKSLKLAREVIDGSQMQKSDGNLFIVGIGLLVMQLGVKIVETQSSKKTAQKDTELAQSVKVD